MVNEMLVNGILIGLGIAIVIAFLVWFVINTKRFVIDTIRVNKTVNYIREDIQRDGREIVRLFTELNKQEEHFKRKIEETDRSLLSLRDDLKEIFDSFMVKIERLENMMTHIKTDVCDCGNESKKEILHG